MKRSQSAENWRKSIPGRGHSLCKGPGAGPCLVLLEAQQEGLCGRSRVSKGERWRREGQGGGKIPLHIFVQGLVGCREYLNFWRWVPKGCGQRRGGTCLGAHGCYLDAIWSLQRVQTVGSQSWGTRWKGLHWSRGARMGNSQGEAVERKSGWVRVVGGLSRCAEGLRAPFSRGT